MCVYDFIALTRKKRKRKKLNQIFFLFFLFLLAFIQLHPLKSEVILKASNIIFSLKSRLMKIIFVFMSLMKSLIEAWKPLLLLYPLLSRIFLSAEYVCLKITPKELSWEKNVLNVDQTMSLSATVKKFYEFYSLLSSLKGKKLLH